jgi:hypothetical protein
MSRFQAVPISAAVVDAARARLSEGDPTVVRVVVETPLSSPCRRCLRDGEPGEAMLLFTHAPFEHAGPYVETGPVFAHEHECGGDDIAPDAVPAMTTAPTITAIASTTRSSPPAPTQPRSSRRCSPMTPSPTRTCAARRTGVSHIGWSGRPRPQAPKTPLSSAAPRSRPTAARTQCRRGPAPKVRPASSSCDAC